MNNKEVEIKFGVLGEPANLMKILSSIGKVTGEHIDTLSNTYFDTEDQRLYAVQAGVRIRRASQYTEQTLKVKGENIAGIHTRGEYNISIPNDTKVPDLSLFPKEAFGPDFDLKSIQEQLKAVCQIDFVRRSFDFEVMNSTFEVCYDHGGIKLADGTYYPINELEVEIKRTAVSDDEIVMLFSTLSSIFAERGLPLVLEPFSKMHRATILLQNRRNSLDFSNMAQTASLNDYILELIKSFERLYGLFLIKHDPLVFTYLNSTIYTMIKALKQLKKSGKIAFTEGEREPVNYADDLKVIIKILKSLYRKSSKIEEKFTKLSLANKLDKVQEQVDAMRKVECRYQAFLIPLKLRLLLSMLVK